MLVFIYLFLLVQLIIVSYFDLKVKKISNKWSIVNLTVFVLLLFIYPGFYPLEFRVLFIPFVIFFVSFALFALKIMGAGDSKYLTTFYLIVPVTYQEDSFWLLTISTVVVGSFVFLLNIFRNIDKIIISIKTSNVYGIKEAFGSRFSFAPVVLLAWVWFGWINRENIFF